MKMTILFHKHTARYDGQLRTERRGKGREGLTGNGDVATTAVASERVSDGSECSSHGVREQSYLVRGREGGREGGRG